MCKVINNICFIYIYITFLNNAFKTLDTNWKFHNLILFLEFTQTYGKIFIFSITFSYFLL